MLLNFGRLLELYRKAWRMARAGVRGLVTSSRNPSPAPRPGLQLSSQAAEAEEGYFYLYLNKNNCDARCIFCSRSRKAFRAAIRREQARHDFQAELQAIRKRIASWSEPAVFHIGGHEPAIYPTLLPIVQAAGERGFRKIILETNGLALSDGRLVEELKAAGLNEVRLPIYGLSAAVHDSITGVAGSFEKLQQTMENLRRNALPFQLKTVVLKQNLHQLPLLLQRYPEMGFSFVMPWSVRPQSYRRVCPQLIEVPVSVLGRVGNLYLPCLFPPRPRWHDPAPQSGEGWVVLSDGRMVYQGNRKNLSAEQLAQMKLKPAKCSCCSRREKCSGIYPAYLKIYRDGEFRPLS
jgi:hypothetical protein